MVNYYGDLFYRLVLLFYRNLSSAKSTFKKCMLQGDLSDTLLILSFVVLHIDVEACIGVPKSTIAETGIGVIYRS